jgi:hypothetical protein
VSDLPRRFLLQAVWWQRPALSSSQDRALQFGQTRGRISAKYMGSRTTLGLHVLQTTSTVCMHAPAPDLARQFPRLRGDNLQRSQRKRVPVNTHLEMLHYASPHHWVSSDMCSFD